MSAQILAVEPRIGVSFSGTAGNSAALLVTKTGLLFRESPQSFLRSGDGQAAPQHGRPCGRLWWCVRVSFYGKSPYSPRKLNWSIK